MQETAEAKVQEEMHAEVGRRIRELRQTKHFLQEELARKAGLSASALSNFEQGRRRISLEWLRKLSKVLGVTVSDLIPDSRVRKPLAENDEEENLLASWRKIRERQNGNARGGDSSGGIHCRCFFNDGFGRTERLPGENSANHDDTSDDHIVEFSPGCLVRFTGVSLGTHNTLWREIKNP